MANTPIAVRAGIITNFQSWGMGNGEWGGKRGIETIYFFNRVNTPARSAILPLNH